MRRVARRRGANLGGRTLPLERAPADHVTAAAVDYPSHLLVTFHGNPFPPAALARLAAVQADPERLRESVVVGARRTAKSESRHSRPPPPGAP